ncbi:MAG: RIO1 family regulatory kinase/ATPase domain-containing protein, partial [Myxococcaceae bacterium]
HPEEAVAMYQDLRAQVIKMLCQDLIHGDLSPYNVLLGAEGPVIIDFPQIVSAAHNSRAEFFFRRDMDSLRGHFELYAPDLKSTRSESSEIWRAHVRRELTPDFVPAGMPEPARQQHGHQGHGHRGPGGQRHEQRSHQGRSDSAGGQRGKTQVQSAPRGNPQGQSEPRGNQQRQNRPRMPEVSYRGAPPASNPISAQSRSTPGPRNANADTAGTTDGTVSESPNVTRRRRRRRRGGRGRGGGTPPTNSGGA